MTTEQLNKLTADIANETTVVKSATILMSGLTAAVKDAKAKQDAGDATAIDTLIATLEANSNDLSAAVVANTLPADTTSDTSAG